MKRYRHDPVKQTPPTLERVQAKEARGYSMKRERAKLDKAGEKAQALKTALLGR